MSFRDWFRDWFRAFQFDPPPPHHRPALVKALEQSADDLKNYVPTVVVRQSTDITLYQGALLGWVVLDDESHVYCGLPVRLTLLDDFFVEYEFTFRAKESGAVIGTILRSRNVGFRVPVRPPVKFRKGAIVCSIGLMHTNFRDGEDTYDKHKSQTVVAGYESLK